MLYRRLTIAELEMLTQEFIHFLAANGIAGDDWEKIKTQNRLRMEAFLDDFSDMVFQTTIEKTDYLLHTQAQELMVFEMQKEASILYSIRLENAGMFSFLDFQTMQTAFDAIPITATIHQFNFTKKYQQTREREIFLLLENNCTILQKPDFEVFMQKYN